MLCPSARVRTQLTVCVRPNVRALKGFGIWFGHRSIYMPKMLRPDAANLLALLWGVWTKQKRLYTPPLPGLTSFFNDGNLPAAFLAAAGFRILTDEKLSTGSQGVVIVAA